MSDSALTVESAISYLRDGKIIAYPTEAVFGLGCDPKNMQALMRLRAFKSRDEKGFILVAANFEQTLSWVNWSKLTALQVKRIQHSWPGPYTWVLPASRTAMPLALGPKHTVAIRVSSHPVVKNLCESFGGLLVSTSANLPGEPPAKTLNEIELLKKSGIIDCVVKGELGSNNAPSKVIDAMTNKILRG